MRPIGIVVPLAALLLAACGAPSETVSPPTRTPVPTGTAVVTPTEASLGEPSEDLARYDTQGVVEFAVLPLGLDPQAETIEFEIGMNTHSVDVGWDLASQSSLSTDTGLEVGGMAWPIGSGHHYGGVLVFPASTPDGARLLEGAGTLTLIIRDTDVPERIFLWHLD